MLKEAILSISLVGKIVLFVGSSILICKFVILSAFLPRYVRVNTLKASVVDVIEHFCKDGFCHISDIGNDFEQ